MPVISTAGRTTHADSLLADIGPSHAMIKATLAGTVGSAVFYVRQNREGTLGGPIHWAKAAWLNMAILSFLVLPGMWWRFSTAGPEVRAVLGVLSGSFLARGIAEMPLIATKTWKCGYGISHDAFAFLTMGAMLLRSRDQLRYPRDSNAVAFSMFVMALLVVEGYFAKSFRAVQDPATGIYYADDSPRFRRIVRLTKLVVFIAYPVLALILWRSRHEFPRVASRG